MTCPEQRTLHVDLGRLPNEAFLLRSDRALGHGSSEARDIVMIATSELDLRTSRDLVSRVRETCQALATEKRPFVLIGPGRWGSADPLLGIGVAWRDIAAARAIVELPLGDRHVEPSQGTHFFRNITAARVGYITIDEQSLFDRAWLEEEWNRCGRVENGLVRHLTLERPFEICLDGKRGMAAIVKPPHAEAAQSGR